MTELEVFAACVRPDSVDNCWLFQGGTTFLIGGKHLMPARACLILHGVNICGKKVTHICGNSLCTNLKHLRVTGRYIHVKPKLFQLSHLERFQYDIDKTGQHWVRLGPPYIQHGGKQMVPRVYLAELYGLPGCKAKDIQSNCGDKTCLKPEHLLINGKPFKKVCPKFANTSREDTFWSNIKKMPHNGCYLWIGRYTKTGEPTFWDGAEYVPARYSAATYQQLGFSPIAGAAGRTCGNIRCVRASHFIDPRPLLERWRTNFVVRDYGYLVDGTRSPCWLWAGGTRYRLWPEYVPDEFELTKCISPERISLLLADRGAYMGRITHECGHSTCGHPDHLTRAAGRSFDYREFRKIIEDRA